MNNMPFSDEEIYQAVKNNLDRVREYIGTHGGGIKLLGVKDATVYIQLTGSCHGCSMSLLTTKMVVEKELKKLIHPDLLVVNIDAGKEDEIPEGTYKEESSESGQKESLMGKIKKMF